MVDLGDGGLAASLVAKDIVKNGLNSASAILRVREADLTRWGGQVGQCGIQVRFGQLQVVLAGGAAARCLPQAQEHEGTTGVTTLSEMIRQNGFEGMNWHT